MILFWIPLPHICSPYPFILLFPAPPQPECRIDPDCPKTKACVREECVNPCHTTTCGINAECRVNNHRALCICKPGYEGDPYEICEERKSDKWECCLSKINLQKKSHPCIFQLDVRVMMSARFIWHATTESVKTLVFMSNVVKMPNAL